MAYKLIGKKTINRNKSLDFIIGFVFIVGLALLYWEILIYRRTIIEFKFPLILWLTPAVFFTPLFYTKLNEIAGRLGNWILHFVLHACTTGSFILFIFMASNFYFADNVIVNKKLEIIDSGSVPGPKGHRNRREPYVVVKYKGIEKQLFFKYEETKLVDTGKFVNISVKKGFLGFDILDKVEIEQIDKSF